MNTILSQLSDVKLPPVVVKIDEDSLKNIYVMLVFVGATLISMWALVNYFSKQD